MNDLVFFLYHQFCTDVLQTDVFYFHACIEVLLIAIFYCQSVKMFCSSLVFIADASFIM